MGIGLGLGLGLGAAHRGGAACTGRPSPAAAHKGRSARRRPQKRHCGPRRGCCQNVRQRQPGRCFGQLPPPPGTWLASPRCGPSSFLAAVGSRASGQPRSPPRRTAVRGTRRHSSRSCSLPAALSGRWGHCTQHGQAGARWMCGRHSHRTEQPSIPSRSG